MPDNIHNILIDTDLIASYGYQSTSRSKTATIKAVDETDDNFNEISSLFNANAIDSFKAFHQIPDHINDNEGNNESIDVFI